MGILMTSSTEPLNRLTANDKNEYMIQFLRSGFFPLRFVFPAKLYKIAKTVYNYQDYNS